MTPRGNARKVTSYLKYLDFVWRRRIEFSCKWGKKAFLDQLYMNPYEENKTVLLCWNSSVHTHRVFMKEEEQEGHALRNSQHMIALQRLDRGGMFTRRF